MAITQKDIAQRVGVSQQAVAHALSGKGRLSETTRERILEEATRMGYRPNPLARALLTGKTNLIALWMPQMLSPFYAQVAHAVETLVRQSPYDLIVAGLDDLSRQQQSAHASASAGWPVDGVLAYDAPRIPQWASQVAGTDGAPIVSIGEQNITSSKANDLVTVDLRPGAEEAVRHLLASSDRVAFLAVPALFHEQSPRYVAYTELMHEAGRKIELIPVPSGSHQRALARQAIKDFVQEKGCPGGIFCGNDEQAIGVFRGLRDVGFDVPKDAAIVGCDGIADTEFIYPSISTIKQPIEEMCRHGWKLLQERIENPGTPRRVVELTAHLEIRESSTR